MHKWLQEPEQELWHTISIGARADCGGTDMAWRYPSTPIFYRGVYFRAVLEARWAATFDELGLLWNYEPETTILSDGSYKADFRLPEPDVYVEIKPTYEFAEICRYKELVKQVQRPFLLIAGPPKVGWYHLRYFAVEEDEEVGLLLQGQFAQRRNKKLWIAQQEIAVCLTYDAKPRKAPQHLEVNSPFIAECMARADSPFGRWSPT